MGKTPARHTWLTRTIGLQARDNGRWRNCCWTKGRRCTHQDRTGLKRAHWTNPPVLPSKGREAVIGAGVGRQDVRPHVVRVGGDWSCNRSFRFGHARKEFSTLRLRAWFVLETDLFEEDRDDGAGADNGTNALAEASKRAFRR